MAEALQDYSRDTLNKNYKWSGIIARPFYLSLGKKGSATSYCSLNLPLAALANVPLFAGSRRSRSNHKTKKPKQQKPFEFFGGDGEI